jgi:hypothetical protein
MRQKVHEIIERTQTDINVAIDGLRSECENFFDKLNQKVLNYEELAVAFRNQVNQPDKLETENLVEMVSMYRQMEDFVVTLPSNVKDEAYHIKFQKTIEDMQNHINLQKRVISQDFFTLGDKIANDLSKLKIE